MTRKTARVWFPLAAVLSFLGSGLVQAGIFDEESKDLIESRSYIGGFGILADINRSGDFDGTVVSTGGSFPEANLLPQVTRNYGGGGLLGYREGPYAIEFSYWRSDHKATFGPAESTASYQSINFDLKRYFFTKAPTQLFAQAGLSLPWFILKDGSNTVPPGPIPADASYKGIGFNVGGGFEIYASKKISIFAGAIQRFAGYDRVKGIFRQEQDLTIPGSGATIKRKADGLNFQAGITIEMF